MTQPNSNVVNVTLTTDVAGQRFIGYTGTYATAAATALGVSNLSGKSGQQLGVQINGIVEVLAGGAITVGAAVKVGTDGKVVAQGGTGTIVGRAFTASNGDGESILIHLIPN